MASARERTRKTRKVLRAKPTITDLVEPMAEASVSTAEPIREKIKVKKSTLRQSALVAGDGQSMSMDMD